MQDKANAILINASRMDEEFDGIATGLSSAITKDGQTTVTADLPMAGFKHTGVGNASARNQYAAVAQVQDGASNYAVAGGTGDAITLTASPAITAYAAGQVFWARLTADNATTTPTLAVSGLAAKTIKKRGATTGQALAAGDLKAGNVAVFAYQSATDTFELLTPANQPGLKDAATWTGVQTFSNGIAFANETLSAYDEGTFTPGIAFGGASTGVTYAEQAGGYLKIGQLVFAVVNVTLSNKGSSSGNATVTGLPFASQNQAYHRATAAVRASNVNLDVAGSLYALVALLDANTTACNLYETGDNVASALITDADFANNTALAFSIVYRAAA